MVAFVAVRNSSFQSQEILILNCRVWTISVAGNPDFLAVNSIFQTNAYALYNMKQCYKCIPKSWNWIRCTGNWYGRMAGCTEPNNKRLCHHHVHVDRRLTMDLSMLNPQTNIDHRRMERGLRWVQACSSGQCQSLRKRRCQPLPNKMIKPN